MGDLSYHFNHRDFACHCQKCRSAIRIHLGLVGILEKVWNHFNKPVRIVGAYKCNQAPEKKIIGKKDYYALGKAVDIRVDEVPLPRLYTFLASLEEIKGLGFYPQKNYIYLDTRLGEREEWVEEQSHLLPLTPERRKRYGLNS